MPAVVMCTCALQESLTRLTKRAASMGERRINGESLKYTCLPKFCCYEIRKKHLSASIINDNSANRKEEKG